MVDVGRESSKLLAGYVALEKKGLDQRISPKTWGPSYHLFLSFRLP